MKKSDFSILYIIQNITSITPTKSKETDDNYYPASVKFRASLYELREDEELGQTERQVHTEFIIPCDDEDLKEFNAWLRHQQQQKRILHLKASFPIAGSAKSLLVVLSTLTAKEILAEAKKSLVTKK